MKADPLLGKIDSVYLWKLKDQRIINLFPFSSHSDWSKLNYRHSEIKERIKDHYSIEQNDHCVYCRLPINYKGWDEPIEHIIHKDFKFEFMFTPLNLALSCRHCNTKKSTKHALRKPSRMLLAFPHGSQHYRILHPHYDNFEDFITLEDGLFYKSIRRDKGILHIRFFKLNEETVLIKRAKAIKISNQDYYKRLIHKISDAGISNSEKRYFRRVANELIARRPL